MRCQFCGWDNPNDKDTCEKCNKPLASNVRNDNPASATVRENRVSPADGRADRSHAYDSDGIQGIHDHPTERRDAIEGAFNPKATVRETPSGYGAKKECPECGYPLDNDVCAACGYSPADESQPSKKVEGEARKTLRPIRKAEKELGFKLVPISEQTGMPEGDEISYDGSNVTLNRDNTDPDNTTITSREQASISCEHGKWLIEDNSEYKTSFVQASRKIELRSGDLILLGNQLFRFEI